MSWHDRPILAPVVYGLSSLATGSLSYTAFYLFFHQIRMGIYADLFMNGLLVLYLRESHREARREGK